MIYPATEQYIDLAHSAIENGEVIVYPTDTLYGFGVDATNSKAIESLNLLKNRKDPLSIIVSSLNEIEKYGKLNEDVRELVDRILPGPFTILIDSIDSNCPYLKSTSPGIIALSKVSACFLLIIA